MPEGTPYRPAGVVHSSRWHGLFTDTYSDALGGKIEMISRGPIVLHDTTVPPMSQMCGRLLLALGKEQGGNISPSAGVSWYKAGWQLSRHTDRRQYRDHGASV